MSEVTNVTYLPWVTPEQTEGGVSPRADVREETPLLREATKNSRRSATVSFQDVDEQEISSDDEMAAHEQVLLKKLNRADLSVSEVSQWLLLQGAPERESAELVEKFIRLNYLDDERLAASLVSRLGERKGKSKSVIARELRQRGIPASIIDSAISVIVDEDELEKACELAVARMRQFSQLDDQTAQRRLMGFLSRRGYSSDTVRQACTVAMESRA